MDEDLITRDEAATLLGLSVSRIRQLEASGDLTALKNSKTALVRFRGCQVRELLAQRKLYVPRRSA